MQEFNIKGKITAIAEVKTQMDNSPLVMPPSKELQNENLINTQSFINDENNYSNSIKENAAILKEFGNTFPEIINNLRAMSDIVAQSNQNFAAFNNRKIEFRDEQNTVYNNIPDISNIKTQNNQEIKSSIINDFNNRNTVINDEQEKKIINDREESQDNVLDNNTKENEIIEKTLVTPYKKENTEEYFNENKSEFVEQSEEKIDRKQELIQENPIEQNKNISNENSSVLKENEEKEILKEPDYNNQGEKKNSFIKNDEEENDKRITNDNEKTINEKHIIQEVVERQVVKEKPVITEQQKEELYPQTKENDLDLSKSIYDEEKQPEERQYPQLKENNLDLSKNIYDEEKQQKESQYPQKKEIVENDLDLSKNIYDEEKQPEERQYPQTKENNLDLSKNIYDEEKNDKISYIPEISETENKKIIKQVENEIEIPDEVESKKTFFDISESKEVDNDKINKQNEQIIFSQQEISDQENKQDLIEAENNVIDSLKNNENGLKECNEILPDLTKNFRTLSDTVVQSNNNLPSIDKNKKNDGIKMEQLAGYSRQGFMNLLNTGNNTIQSLSGGNIGNAGIGIVSGTANAVDTAAKMAKASELAGLSSGLLAAGGVLAAGAAVLKGGKALADSYKEAMPTIFETGKAFGTTDTDESFKLYQTVNRKNTGTNLDIDSFNSVVQSLRKQGVAENYKEPINQAAMVANIAQTTSKWAYATGGNVEQYAELAGLMSRYGKSQNVSEDFNYLVAAGKASGLNDTQIPEFLSGIKKVMEEGISKGFTRSATEVADTLLMFSKMSGGNEFWKGEQGTRLLSQANSGIASSTALAKTEDILVYRAMQNAYRGTIKDKNGNEIDKTQNALGDTYVKNGGYINTMQLIEKGISPENFDDIMETLNNAYADNTAAKIEALRKMTGLNYTGAARLLNLDTNSKDLDSQIKKITNAPENMNNETRWQKDLNNIAEALQKGGKPLFQVELKAMDSVSSDVKRIADFIIPGSEASSPISDNNKSEQDLAAKGELTPEYYEEKANAETYAEENFSEGQQVLLREVTERGVVDPEGTKFQKDIDYVESRGVEKEHTEDETELESIYTDVHNETMYDWNSPVIRKTNRRDLPNKLKKKGTQEEIDEWYEQNPLIFENKNKLKDFSYEGMFLRNTNEKRKEIMPDSGVSMEALEAALKDPKYAEATKAAKEAIQPRSDGGLTITKSEIEGMNLILEKILGELKAGITVTENR